MSSSLPYDAEGHRADSARRSSTPVEGMRPVAPDAVAGAARTRTGARAHAHLTRQHHPRVLAALCYTVPIIPAWTLLARRGSERANPFVRFHAAQALVFQGLIAISQILLYLLLIIPGGLVTDDRLAIALAALLLVLYLAQVVVIFAVWSSLMADCIRGNARVLPVAGGLALRLERFAPRQTWARLRGKPVPAE